MKDFSEADMYDPVKRFFTELGYDVKGEVRGCDVVAVKDKATVIVELKKGLNLKLVFQAMERQKITNQVYIAVPRPGRANARDARNAVALAQKLELGFLTVAMDSPVKTVEILNFPPLSEICRSKAKKADLLKELGGRTMDLNRGGGRGRKLLTAYRERVIRAACLLERMGEASPAALAALGCGKTVGRILYNDSYGWFIRRGKGLYALSQRGLDGLNDAAFAEIVEYYRGESAAEPRN